MTGPPDDGWDDPWEGSAPVPEDALEAEREKRGKGSGPREAAGVLMSERKFRQDAFGHIYEYDGACGFWRERRADTLRAIVHSVRPRFNLSKRNETIAWIAAASHDAELTWGRLAHADIPLANGVLDLERMELRAHDASDMLDYVVPHAWRPEATSELWLRCVDDWLGIESAAAQALQEFFGYVLMSHAAYKKALVCYGPDHDTGKSRIPETLAVLVGRAARCSIGVEHMEDPRRLALIKHKRLNTITELSADAMIRDGGFKTLVSTEEPVLIDEKYGAIETYTPVAKHVIATNVLPQVGDRTRATFSRLLIIPFMRRVAKKRQDRFLDAKIAAEIEGVVAWSVIGAARLSANRGEFTEVPEAAETMAEWLRESTPIIAFLNEHAHALPENPVPLSRIAEEMNRRGVWHRKVTARQVGHWARQALGREAVRDHRFGDRVAKCLFGWNLTSLDVDAPGGADTTM